jgi:hypothetical protein
MPTAIMLVAMSAPRESSFGPSGVTASRRFTEWSQARVWAKLHRLILDELGSQGELDWSPCAIGSVSVRAVKGGLWPDRIRPIAARADPRTTSS